MMGEASTSTSKAGLARSVAALLAEVTGSRRGAKRTKLRTLLNRFGYSRRTDGNTAEVTRALTDAGIAINPPITRLGANWGASLDDWVHLSISTGGGLGIPFECRPAAEWNADGWFDRIGAQALRTEKEVEIKFIVPLLTRLGYDEDDRYDGMPVPAAHGSRDTTLVVDFALFNVESEVLRNQPLLTVEAKRETRLAKQRDLLSAHNQAKSYCLWTQCDFFMVTDSRTVHAFHIERGRLGDLRPIFECARGELKDRFEDLYRLLSKDALTHHYSIKFAKAESGSREG